ncbi:hypothetical protein [Haloplanus vescus]|uniref:hypothetical protein n=1 Tax=Haloplanus vescus TaxID=555874 RepID=UPI00115FCDE0|nr:hypothetical protein [Haloplanus vescus]
MSEEESLDTPQNEEWLDLNYAYHLGKVMNYLYLAAGHEFPFTSYDDEDGNYILDGLEDVTYIFKKSRLDTSVLTDIEHTKNDLIESYISEEDERDEGKIHLDQNDYNNLLKTVDTWENIITEELASIGLIRIENRGLIDVEQAMQNPKELFHEKSM